MRHDDGVVMAFGLVGVLAVAGAMSSRGSKAHQPSLFGRKADLRRDQQLPVPDAWRPFLRQLAAGGPGEIQRLVIRSHVELVPELVSRGYVEVVREAPLSSAGAGWGSVDVRVTAKLCRDLQRAREARESYRDEVLQVGLFDPKDPP